MYHMNYVRIVYLTHLPSLSLWLAARQTRVFLHHMIYKNKYIFSKAMSLFSDHYYSFVSSCFFFFAYQYSVCSSSLFAFLLCYHFHFLTLFPYLRLPFSFSAFQLMYLFQVNDPTDFPCMGILS